MIREDVVNRWNEKVTDPIVREQLDALLNANDESAIDDAFFQDLEFGTAGLRGVIGAGTNRMNVYTVGKATMGVAAYLNSTFSEPTVAIARDSRNMGNEFVRHTARILASQGIKSFLYPRIEPVPALSFAVRHLGTSAGICMTASHNPAEYNGYKVYGADGCQITSDAASNISAAIAGIDEFSTLEMASFEEYEEQGLITWIDDSVITAFIDAELEASMADPDASDVSLKLVYTPLNGSGLECNSLMFERIGVTDVTVVEEQAEPNGDFPTCPYPNPEIREAMEKGIETCERVHPDLLLATDPDADRVGIAVKNGGDYQLLTGNEVGILMLDYLCRMRSKAGKLPSDAVAVSTIVSTVMIDKIAAHWGVRIQRTLTGFKYIGNVITDLVNAGREEAYVLGFEESYGYLAATHVRDKDSICASMIICQMAQHYRKRGMNLAQAIEELYREYGYFRNKTVSISFPGADGARKMAGIMSTLRTQAPSEIAGYPVQEVIDYQDGYNDLPKANVLEFRLPNMNKVIIRPSGTEPKIKAYLFSNGETAELADELTGKLEAAARELLS